MSTRIGFRIVAIALMMLGSLPIASAQYGPSATLTSALDSEAILFGPNAVPAGDVDGDGVGDFIRGAGLSFDLLGPAGDDGVTVVSGATGDLIWTLRSPNENADGSFGYAVAAAGDINADGHADLIVGAPSETYPGFAVEAGLAYVFSGATGNVYHILSAPVETAYGRFGASVNSPGDVSGDGLPDIAVGTTPDNALHPGGVLGSTFVYSGATGLYLWPINAPAFVEAHTAETLVASTNAAF